MTRRVLLLPGAILSKMLEERRSKLPFETGGFLVGLRRGVHFDVGCLTQQALADVATRSSFERADPAHAATVQSAWENSSGEMSLIGDWHSHPSGDGSPSGQDRAAWRRMTSANKQDCVGLILGDAPLPRAFLVRHRFPLPSIVEFEMSGLDGEDAVFAVDVRPSAISGR